MSAVLGSSASTVVVHRAQGVDGRVDAGGDQVDDLGGAVLVGRELRQRRAGRHGVGATVGNRVQRAHPLGDGVAGLAGEVDQFVELQVQVAEVGSDDVPVRLLALQVQFDEVHQDPLQVAAQLGGGLKVLDIGIGTALSVVDRGTS